VSGDETRVVRGVEVDERTIIWRDETQQIELVDRTVVWEAPAPPRAPARRLPAPPPPHPAREPRIATALAHGSAPQPLVLPPALGRDVFQLARRVALQSDLSAAVRVLRQGLVQLTLSQDASCIFIEPEPASVWMPPDGDQPLVVNDQVEQLIAQVATSGRRVAAGAVIVEPVGAAPARAVLVLRRPPPRDPYGPLELAIVAAIASAVAGILGHFRDDHAAKQAQAARDAKTPFRPEALAERRRAIAAPGRVVATPRRWIRWAFPTLLGLVVAIVVAAALIQVPTYSTGVAIVTVDGEQITAPMPGTVAQVLVAPNARVAAGDPLVRMRALQEEAEVAATETDYRNALATFLTNPGDESARIALAAIATRRQRAQAAVEAHTLRATKDGVVGDIRVHAGQLLAPGAQVVKIASAGAVPAVVALLPGFDRPRLEIGMTVQIELPGYHKKREEAVIDSIGSQVVGPDEARRSLGDPIGDALPISGPVVIVRAHLATRTFEAEGREYEFHDGMLGKAEVRVDQQTLLRALLPGGEGG
jgi:biotin carboxyl carrier protein